MAIAQPFPGQHIRIATNAVTEPYWQATRERRLTAARCAECGRFRMPPTPFCPVCNTKPIDWVELKGPGRVYSFTVCTRSPFPDVEHFTYMPALVEFDAAPGIRFTGNIVGIEPTQARIDMLVDIDWTETSDGWAVPVFRAAGHAA